MSTEHLVETRRVYCQWDPAETKRHTSRKFLLSCGQEVRFEARGHEQVIIYTVKLAGEGNTTFINIQQIIHFKHSFIHP